MMGGLGGIMGTRRQMPFGGMSPISLINLFGRLGSSIYSGQTSSPIGGIFGGGMTRPGGGLLGGLGNLGMTGFGSGMMGGLGNVGMMGGLGGMVGGLGGIMGTRRQMPFGGMSPISMINLFGRLGSSVFGGQTTSPIGGIFGGGMTRPGGGLLGGLGNLGMTGFGEGMGGQTSSAGLLCGLLGGIGSAFGGGAAGGGLFGGLFDSKKTTSLTTPDTPLAGPQNNYNAVANEAPAKTMAEDISQAPTTAGVDKMDTLTEMMNSETAKLDEMISLMRKQNSTSDKLLKAQT
jgi:hypothetical protein